MRIDGPIEGLTEAQKKLADIAGVPANRPGLGDEYPKMVYRRGDNPRHILTNEALPVGNGAYDARTDKLGKGEQYETAFVDNAEDEAQAVADGWLLSVDPVAQEKHALRVAAEREKDDEIARLRAELAGRTADPEKRGPGRPPKPQPEDEL